MTARSLHRTVGLVMLLPFLAWAVTGAIFFIKPGYGGAYDTPAIPMLPLGADPVPLGGNPAWLEVRYVRTTLGLHLMVRTASGWQQLDPPTLTPRLVPEVADLKRLIESAFTANPARYGRVASMNGLVATTDTGVTVTLNWNRLSLSQRGSDTDRIDRIYKIHYLQWTGIETLDRVVGAIGLILVVVLSALGVRLLLRSR